MSYINTQASTSYKEVVEATESIEAPALGFIKPADHKGARFGPSTIIKQNNTQLHLLVIIAEKLEKIEEKIQKLKAKAEKAPILLRKVDALVKHRFYG